MYLFIIYKRRFYYILLFIISLNLFLLIDYIINGNKYIFNEINLITKNNNNNNTININNNIIDIKKDNNLRKTLGKNKIKNNEIILNKNKKMKVSKKKNSKYQKRKKKEPKK